MSKVRLLGGNMGEFLRDLGKQLVIAAKVLKGLGWMVVACLVWAVICAVFGLD